MKASVLLEDIEYLQSNGDLDVEVTGIKHDSRTVGSGDLFCAICGQVEMELSQLNDDEALEFRSSMGLVESGLDRMIRVSYGLLGLLSFFTVASDEVRAWTVRRNTTVQRAAGKVHSDMERGFIRAEVIGFDDLDRCGGMAEARKQGLLS